MSIAQDVVAGNLRAAARLMRDAFRSRGHTADVYALELDQDLEGDGRRFADWKPGGPDDVLILHYALPSPLTAALREHRGRRVRGAAEQQCEEEETLQEKRPSSPGERPSSGTASKARSVGVRPRGVFRMKFCWIR